MKPLSIGVALFGILALVQPVIERDASGALLGVAMLLCAAATLRSIAISSFLRIFVGIFCTETILFGAAATADHAGLWPVELLRYRPPLTLPLTVAAFAILVYVVARFDAVRQITQIADRYFDADELGHARVWPFRRFRARERHVAIALVVVLVLLNQAEVAVLVRLNFFNRDLFDAIQNRATSVFWQQLLFVFTPWAFGYVGMTLVEFFMRSMLIIRWRRWLTDHFVSRWLSRHNHYRISLVAGQTDNPDQRIAEDIFRFINGGSDGSITAYGLYDFSILLISTITSLISFSVVLWNLSTSFTWPGTTIALPGFLFWVALIYAGLGTVITHLIGRPLVALYFKRQHMEADFRFSLARLREYTEQIALLGGEGAEQAVVGGRFAALITNYLAVVFRLMRVTAFTQTFGQLSPIIPYVFTAPFYFSGKIELGVMTQTAQAFGQVAAALTFFVTYYTYLAAFKSVVDRLNSFDVAIQQAQALSEAGPHRVAEAGGETSIVLDDIDLCLPGGRHIVEMRHLELAPGQSVAVSGPSGSGKSTLFRAIAGVWPYGDGSIRIPQHARIMVVPPRPYIPTGTLRAAVTYPAKPDIYSDEVIRSALTDAHLGGLADQLDREDQWSQRLSSGEQQRVAIARALLMRPDWLFLDESTSAVDEKLEAELYAVLARRLPKATLMSIGHRSTVVALHQRHLQMSPVADKFRLADAATAAAGQ
ncbi:ABC transporter ATP-binding protein/permease [Bradyrhizobium sp.]|uniref:ABC transporter ATP-binding protein/permease n=1 Tax=Bradyrhizobium sp. TaxID=376 RepID=UPI0026373067|nr:ABC transporter ATP-binding protein/permease [Bradyrhizobium sp.]